MLSRVPPRAKFHGEIWHQTGFVLYFVLMNKIPRMFPIRHGRNYEIMNC